jgi:hypothetical protein
MADARRLWAMAEQMSALAINAGDSKLTDWLSIRAGEYLDQAQALETQQVAQQAEQPQPNEPDDAKKEA